MRWLVLVVVEPSRFGAAGQAGALQEIPTSVVCGDFIEESGETVT